MRYRKLDSSGDYTFGQTNEFYGGTNAVAQAIYTNLKLLYGEWWEDTSAGLPLFQQILGRPGTPDDLRAVDLLIQSCINQVPGVINISNFISTCVNRKYSATCTVKTPYGDATMPIEFNF
jgi:hypothetical protein